jgi:hypothetical protein
VKNKFSLPRPSICLDHIAKSSRRSPTHLKSSFCFPAAALNNPPLKIIQEFIHLLSDSEQDFEDELDIESLRQQVIRLIRDNIATEIELSELDLKIALLVKNRISLEEVVLSTRKMKDKLESPTSPQSLSATGPESNPFSSRSTDKESRAKVAKYQQLFYLLQTQPNYLAKLMFTLNKKSGSAVVKFLEQVVLTLYGYAQNSREEYLLLNLIKVGEFLHFLSGTTE